MSLSGPFLALLMSAAAPAPAALQDCSYDRAAMLALDYRSFDQTPGHGWRALAARGCDGQAAELIRKWREHHRESRTILFWHEGQSRAFTGDYPAAIALFERARKAPQDDRIFWNLYVDGSVAFLKGDRARLQAARDALAAKSRPEDWDAMKGTDGKPLNAPWPVNLAVLDGFLRCWGKPYREAYGCPK